MTHDEVIKVLNLHRAWFAESCITQALDYAIAMLECRERVKTRLSQIASGDYKACGHTAEDVAKTALMEFNI